MVFKNLLWRLQYCTLDPRFPKELLMLVFTTPFPFPWLVSTAVVLTAIYSNPEHILSLESQCRHEATTGMSPVIERTPGTQFTSVTWAKWLRLHKRPKSSSHPYNFSPNREVSENQHRAHLLYPPLTICIEKEKHHCIRCTRQGDMDAQRRLEIPDTQQWKAVVAT